LAQTLQGADGLGNFAVKHVQVAQPEQDFPGLGKVLALNVTFGQPFQNHRVFRGLLLEFPVDLLGLAPALQPGVGGGDAQPRIHVLGELGGGALVLLQRGRPLPLLGIFLGPLHGGVVDAPVAGHDPASLSDERASFRFSPAPRPVPPEGLSERAGGSRPRPGRPNAARPIPRR